MPKKLFKLSEICYKKRIKKKYSSDITKEQFEQLRSILEIGRKKTAPRKLDLYEVFCAILYLVKSGCQRRMLPEVFQNGKLFAYGVKALLGEQVDVSVDKRNEMHTFKVIPKWWVVERSFAWLEKQQRLLKNCERKYNTALQFMILTFVALLLRSL